MEAVLACMKRHQSNATVQAVACWSLVNLALIPQQKRALCRQGGVLAVVQAMACHPEDSEVHFRAMFALINLVTPDVTAEKIIHPDTMKVRDLLECVASMESESLRRQVSGFFFAGGRRRGDRACALVQPLGQSLLSSLQWRGGEYVKVRGDDHGPVLVSFVLPYFPSSQSVVAMVVSALQAFSNMVAIVNRGCLVLHNIAIDPGHVNALLAFGAQEELLHAMGRHPSDPLLVQCATGTLRRLGL